MKQLKGALERFYTDVLNDDLFFKDTIEPAALAFGRQPKRYVKIFFFKKKKATNKIKYPNTPTNNSGIDFVSLMEVVLLAAIKSDNREEAVEKMLKLDASDQMFLVQLLDELTRQNGFVDPNADIGNDSLSTPIAIKNGNNNNNANGNTNMNNNNSNKLNDSQHSFLQFSARKYDKTRRIAMQSPVMPRYTRSMLNSNGNSNQGNDATFEFRAFDTNGNGSSGNQLLMSPPQSRGVGKLTNDMYSTSSQYLLDSNKDLIRQLEQENLNLQNDLSRYQTECKQLATENTRIKDEYKFLEDRVRNNMTQEFQRKEKDYVGKIALLEEQSTSFCKEMKNYETTIRSLRSENDKLTKELAQLGSLHDTQIRQYREELEMTKLQLNRLKSYDMQFKKYPQDDLATSAQTKELENQKFRNDQLFNENFELKCQLKQIPQLKEQAEQYKQQLMDYKIRGVGNSQRSGDTLQEVLDELHVQKHALKELTELKEKLKLPSYRGLDCKKCDELQKQIDAITQFSTDQKKKLKEYHSALEQLHAQKTNDCELHKGYIESLRQQVQEV
ncbi:viral A-type inclusion protein [Reticulomyxa filosa]|uniref:Viral A-type inclusion protein n=1 Tax=Reticulomyxa filosa TaxID=46433 RepID=X6NYB2_RETFI|nr:viral A-type inclusion protein [Reticulomyxa filosa]|eukprot:ETO31310.1 viral A-type inclusion protein [Reticulomyxa filosa]